MQHSIHSLEDKFRANLESSGEIGCAVNMPESGRVDVLVPDRKRRVVEYVKRVAAQQQRNALADGNGLEDRKVLVKEHRPVELIPGQVSLLTR